jgi:hypothetical protein
VSDIDRPSVDRPSVDRPSVDRTVVVILSARGGEWNLAVANDAYVGGAKLILRDHPVHPARRRLTFRSDDAAGLGLGGNDASALLAEGGRLRIVGIGGDAFDTEYALAPSRWALLDASDPAAGVRYANSDGPIGKIVFRAGESVRLTGKGAQLGHSLGSEPALVQVDLQLGGRRYCAEFGGASHRFVRGARLARLDAPVRPRAQRRVREGRDRSDARVRGPRTRAPGADAETPSHDVSRPHGRRRMLGVRQVACSMLWHVRAMPDALLFCWRRDAFRVESRRFPHFLRRV